ncbi:hypothetical protein AOQ84DRAFT_367554 [Glonium stellatum]|uniref:Uncharacterized protein n=1 Tax=Glonium stellatum TaxID=574774 RepID=A0A8E2ET34_9PEZI|nr:hypothetical protein AOQ84DRAFT_367554 [Glonium stellatum]
MPQFYCFISFHQSSELYIASGVRSFQKYHPSSTNHSPRFQPVVSHFSKFGVGSTHPGGAPPKRTVRYPTCFANLAKILVLISRDDVQNARLIEGLWFDAPIVLNARLKVLTNEAFGSLGDPKPIAIRTKHVFSTSCSPNAVTILITMHYRVGTILRLCWILSWFIALVYSQPDNRPFGNGFGGKDGHHDHGPFGFHGRPNGVGPNGQPGPPPQQPDQSTEQPDIPTPASVSIAASSAVPVPQATVPSSQEAAPSSQTEAAPSSQAEGAPSAQTEVPPAAAPSGAPVATPPDPPAAAPSDPPATAPFDPPATAPSDPPASAAAASLSPTDDPPVPTPISPSSQLSGASVPLPAAITTPIDASPTPFLASTTSADLPSAPTAAASADSASPSDSVSALGESSSAAILITSLSASGAQPTGAIASPVPDPAAPPSKGMPASAKAGMGVGITFGILSIAGISVFYLFRRRQNNRYNRDNGLGDFFSPTFGNFEIRNAEKVEIFKGVHAERIGLNGGSVGAKVLAVEIPKTGNLMEGNSGPSAKKQTPSDAPSWPLPE